MTTYELTLVGRGEAYPDNDIRDIDAVTKFRVRRPNGAKYGTRVPTAEVTDDLIADLRRQSTALGIEPSRLERVDVPPMPQGLTLDQWEAMEARTNWLIAHTEPRGWQTA